MSADVESPPGNGKGGLQAAYPTKTEKKNAEQDVNDSAAFRNTARGAAQ